VLAGERLERLNSLTQLFAQDGVGVAELAPYGCVVRCQCRDPAHDVLVQDAHVTAQVIQLLAHLGVQLVHLAARCRTLSLNAIKPFLDSIEPFF